ncbi:MAG TPA: nucleotidyltransferase domain-containing protein [Candidatus Hypogeohydataceae bacterium YC41]
MFKRDKKMPVTLRKIRERKKRRKKVLEKELRKIKKQLQDMGALKIILFGSYAYDNVRSWSDLDIISIMPSAKTGKDWMKKIYEEIDREVGCDILAYTAEELERLIPLSRFLRNALETGRVIYERRPQE